MPVERPVDGNFAIVCRQVAAHLDQLAGAVVPTGPVQAPRAIGLVALADADAVVAHQVRRCRGLAMCRKIPGRGAQQAAVVRQFLRDDPRIARLAEADADVELVFGQWRGLTDN